MSASESGPVRAPDSKSCPGEDAVEESPSSSSDKDSNNPLAEETRIVASCADKSQHYMKNSILDEVLNRKKCGLLQSPEVVEFFQAQQRKKKTPKK